MTPILRLLFLLLVSAAPFELTHGQTGGDEQAPTITSLREQIELLQDSAQPDRDELLKTHSQALLELERAKDFERRAAEFQRQIEEAPAMLATLRELLARPHSREEPTITAETALREMELAQQQAEANRVVAQELVDELALEAQHRSERLGQLGDEVARARAAIGERETSLRATTAGDAPGLARRTLLNSELAALRAEERALTTERTAYEARRELLPLRRDQAQRQLTREEFLSKFWQERVSRRRQDEADRAAREAEQQRRETAARFPALSKIAARNEELATLRSGDDSSDGSGEVGVPELMATSSEALLAAQQLEEEAARRFRATRRKIAVGGLTEGMGLLLRREYEWTSPPSILRAESEGRRAELSRAQLLEISLKEERSDAGDIATEHERLMSMLGVVGSEVDSEELSALVRELLTTRRSLQDALIEELGVYIGTLEAHERVHAELLEVMIEYRAYIEERILWVRSTTGGMLPKLVDLEGGFSWLVSGESWRTGLERSAVATRERIGKVLALLALSMGLLLLRGRLRRSQLHLSELVRSYKTDSFRLTTRALLQVLALALPVPLLAWTAGWLMSAPLEQVEVVRCVGQALRSIALTLLALEFLRQATQERHLAEVHFRWPSGSVAVIRTELAWFLPAVALFGGLATTFDLQSSPEWSDGLGRLSFICLMTALAVVLFRLFRPGGRVLAKYYSRTNGLLERTHRLWFGLLVGVPVALIVLSVAGYYYSALQFEGRVRESIGLAVDLLLINALLLRSLFIARRRLAVEQARTRTQAKTKVQAPSEAGTVHARESGSASLDEESVDIPAVDAQTRKLIRSGISSAAFLGLLFIWGSSFPALRALDRIELWPKIRVVPEVEEVIEELAEATVPAAATEIALPAPMVSGAQDSSAEATATSASEFPSVISVADLALALLIFLLTGIATKNAPGVLEITILQRLPLDSGARYALSTLFRYVILFVGLTAGFGAVGLGWNKIQWLAAALTFGLAFGLQEIFANFVSGIIILLERPVRVGDIVTVGEIEGRVTRLRMRATTILDWNRRELLVPNKEFITGNVINWTLSDPVTRLIITVGVAYGSDTKLARELLLKAADETHLVVDDPAPMAIFRRFGDSSLEFELRVFLGNRDLWPEVIDQVHTNIDNAFRAADIEIAFPQRDLHIRSAEGLPWSSPPSS